ncbi:MAG TPA: helix-turn-helix domain-containing protein [Mycobacteriales bacterium]|nr:helix-turn-helix domain-containing protein [Mycobacteriales bacterium]
MPTPVKRSYTSSLRADQARATRRAIIAAATELFVRDGYGPTTVDAIAAAAGVSRKTVFTSVGGKLECLKLGIDWAVAGDDEDVPLMMRDRIRAQMQVPDARAILRDYADMMCDTLSRSARLTQALYDAAGLDPSIRALRDAFEQQRVLGMTNLAQHLDLRGALRRDVSVGEAANILCLQHPTYYPLVVLHGWTHARYIAFVADTVTHALIRPDYEPKPLPRTKRAAEIGVDTTRLPASPR